MNTRLLFWSFTSALAGFLFGFDTVVVSGAEQTIQNLWHLSGPMHGLALGSALWGTVLGAVLGSRPTDRYGRRATLIGIGVLYVVSAAWSGLATDVYSFMAARFLGGVGIGVSTVAAPLFISEVAPPASRGRLTALFQFNIVLGIVVAFASNAVIARVVGGDHAWRWMLGVAAFPSVAYTLLAFALPESPRWLIGARGDRAGGLRVLKLARPATTPAELEAEADAIAAGARTTDAAAASGLAPAGGIDPAALPDRFWSARLRRPILLAFLVAFFNQLSGINAILYFAPRIFELAGLGADAALLQSTGVGLTNLAFTFVGLWLIDRVGRRTLLYVGSAGYIASLGLCAWGFFTGRLGIVPACVFAFIAAHAVGQGTVIWVLIAEVFPDRFRATGQSLGSTTHWVFAALLTTFFPTLVGSVPPGYVFSFFCGMMVLHLVWVWAMVPETKGVPFETIARRLGVTG